MKPYSSEASLSGRAVGYFLWGVAWTIMTVCVVALIWMVLAAPTLGRVSESVLSIILFSAVTVVICAWLFVIAPFFMFAQAMLGFTLSAQARNSDYRFEPLGRMVGSIRARTLEALIETPATRRWTDIGMVGFMPGWPLAAYALVLTVGVALLRYLPAEIMAQGVGWLLTVAGALGVVVSVRHRLVQEAARPWAADSRVHTFTEKYYRGVDYRADKRARDLQKARDAGQAPDASTGPAPTAFDRWAAAEVQHALRVHERAAFEARLGVPGALDAPIADVFEAMGGAVSVAQARDLVVAGAAFRGKPPTYVPGDS